MEKISFQIIILRAASRAVSETIAALTIAALTERVGPFSVRRDDRAKEKGAAGFVG